MRIIFKIFGTLSISLILLNCTIQKRTVKKGYFIQWNFKKRIQETNNEAPNRQNNKYELAEDENITQILDTISNENNNDFLPDNNRNTNYSLVKTETYNISLIEKSESSISKRGLNKNFVKPIKKNKDQTEKQKILKSLLFSFLIFLLGVVLIIIAFSKNYLMIFPLLFGGIFFILGAFFLVVSLLRLILLH